MKQILTLCIALTLAVSLTACGGSYSSSAAMENPSTAVQHAAAPAAAMPDGYYGEEADMAEPVADDVALETGDPAMGGEGGGTQSALLANRKIITTMNLSVQTNDFDGSVAQLPAMIEGMGGYIQDSYVEGSNLYEKYYSRSANFTARIPSEKLDAFGDTLGGLFHIVSRQKSASDITDNYFDTQARLDSLKTQEERLLAMLEESGELQYMLQVEQELANVRYQIESLTTAMNRMNSSIDFSTVTIYIQEVVEYTDSPAPPATFSQRIGYAFNDSWNNFISGCQNLVLLLIAMLPSLIILAVIAVIVIIIVRSYRKRHPFQPKPQSPGYHPPVYTIPTQSPPADASKTEDTPPSPEA